MGDWRVGLLGVFDLTNQKILKEDFVVGWHKNEWDVVLQGWRNWNHQIDDWKDLRQWFSGLSLTSVFRRNAREGYGVEVSLISLSCK